MFYNGGVKSKLLLMKRERFITAEHEAQELSKKLPQLFRVDTDEIVKLVQTQTKYNIRVYSTDFSQFKLNGLSDCGGLISVVKKKSGAERGEAIIYLNSSNSTEMMRFSLMHEIGHLVMFDVDKLSEGKTLVSAQINADITYLSDSIIGGNKYLEAEQAANIFALTILMPKELFLAASRAYTIDKLANLFGVTKEAVISRYMMLGAE